MAKDDDYVSIANPLFLGVKTQEEAEQKAASILDKIKDFEVLEVLKITLQTNGEIGAFVVDVNQDSLLTTKMLAGLGAFLVQWAEEFRQKAMMQLLKEMSEEEREAFFNSRANTKH